MSKYIDIDNEEEILKECDFDYFYNSENCSRELCAFYNDIWRNGNNENFDKRQALIDLGRIGIVLNNKSQQLTELKAENERLKKYETIYYLNQLQASNEDIDKFKQNQIQQSINIYDLLKENTKQVRKEVCEELRKYYTTPIYDRENAHTDVRVLLQRLDQIQGETK